MNLHECWNRETHAVLGPQPGKVGGAFLQQRLESHLLEAALTRQGFGHILRQWDGSAKQQTCSNAGRASAQQSLLHALHLSKKNQTGSKNQVESSESTGMQTSIQSNVAIICTVVENMTNTGVGCAFWLATCKTFMPASDGCCSNHCAIVIEVHVSLGRNSSNCPKFYSCDQSLPLQERKNPSVSLVLLCEPFPCSHGSFDCQFTLPGSSSLFPQPGKTRWPLHVDAFGRFKCIKMQK